MEAEKIAIRIVTTLQKAGHTAYFAGGWVRDFLLKKPSHDIDIVTTASIEQVSALFPKTIPVGAAFGITVVLEENISFEVATFRKEKEYVDGRRPSHIQQATPEEDALRRDFTINGMFFDPVAQKLFDFVGGQEDLNRGIIRAIGDPHQRFLEDRLRMIRAVRYATRFGFPIEIDTAQAIMFHAKSLFPSVAIERVWQELHKMNMSIRFPEGLICLHKLDLLPVIFPKLEGVSLEEIEKRVSNLSKLSPSHFLLPKLLFLFPESSLEEKFILCDYFKLGKQEKELVQFLHSSTSILTMPLDWQNALEPFEWAYFYANTSSSLALTIHSFVQKDPSEFFYFHEKNKQKLSSHIQKIQAKTPLIKADDLQKRGIKPGPYLGKLLKEAEKISINQDLHDKESVLFRLMELPVWKTYDL